MDSPKRKAQKNKDYRRHRMMRLLNRRKATAQEAMSEIAERELMRRLRITPLKKFEDGKGVLLSSIPKLSSTLPDIEMDKPEYEEIKPKKEIPIEPIKPIEQFRTFNKDEDHPILTETQSYVNSPVFVNRLKRMTLNNDAAPVIAGIARENINNTELKNWPTERSIGDSYNSVPAHTPIYYKHYDTSVYPRIRWGRSSYNELGLLEQKLSGPAMNTISYGGNRYTPQGILHERKVLAHELAHSFYEPFKNYNVYEKFTPEYRKVLDRGIQKDSDKSNHDNHWTEKVADIWSLQQFAKDNNIWDKSTDTEFTKEMYDKLKSKMYETFPRGNGYDYNTRSFDMWNDEDLRWLINTTAQNVAPSNNIQYRAYLGKNPGYKMPMYTPLKKFSGGKGVFDYLDEYAEEYEPYAAGLAIGSDAVALGTAATGVGAPIGAAIATAGNIPNLAIDAYQAARNWYKYGQGDNDNLMTPIISTGEAVLDAAGVSSALKGISYLKDRAIANEVARIYEREFAARNGKRFLLRKKGMSDGEIAEYIAQKAANATLNSKELAQTKKKETGKQNRRNTVAKPAVRATSNVATNFVAPQYFDAQNNYKPIWQRN